MLLEGLLGAEGSQLQIGWQTLYLLLFILLLVGNGDEVVAAMLLVVIRTLDIPLRKLRRRIKLPIVRCQSLLLQRLRILRIRLLLLHGVVDADAHVLVPALDLSTHELIPYQIFLTIEMLVLVLLWHLGGMVVI